MAHDIAIDLPADAAARLPAPSDGGRSASTSTVARPPVEGLPEGRNAGRPTMTAGDPGRPPRHRRARLDFAAVNRAALPHLDALCRRWLPGGRRVGAEWTCGSLRGEAGGSCKVNLRTGRWADFAAGQRGGDPVSLAAAVHRTTQVEAALKLARMLGLHAEGRRRG